MELEQPITLEEPSQMQSSESTELVAMVSDDGAAVSPSVKRCGGDNAVRRQRKKMAADGKSTERTATVVQC